MSIILPSIVAILLIGIYLFKKFTGNKVIEQQADYQKKADVLDFKRKELIVDSSKLKEELKQPPKDLKPNEVEDFWNKDK